MVGKIHSQQLLKLNSIFIFFSGLNDNLSNAKTTAAQQRALEKTAWKKIQRNNPAHSRDTQCCNLPRHECHFKRHTLCPGETPHDTPV